MGNGLGSLRACGYFVVCFKHFVVGFGPKHIKIMYVHVYCPYLNEHFCHKSRSDVRDHMRLPCRTDEKLCSSPAFKLPIPLPSNIFFFFFF